MKALITLLFITLTTCLHADEMRYYDIEVVILENLRPKALQSENWPLDVTLNKEEKTIRLGDPVLSEWLPAGTDLAASYKVLPAKNYQLMPQVKKIAKSKTQRVIFHSAWRQPGLAKKIALPIYFKREVPAAPVVTGEGAVKSSSVASSSEPVGSAASLEPSVLEGILRVTLARYLHFEAEVSLRSMAKKINDDTNSISALDTLNEAASIKKNQVIYLKQERRRIRSNELHYLDHPVLGMLLNIKQYIKDDRNKGPFKKTGSIKAR